MRFIDVYKFRGVYKHFWFKIVERSEVPGSVPSLLLFAICNVWPHPETIAIKVATAFRRDASRWIEPKAPFEVGTALDCRLTGKGRPTWTWWMKLQHVRFSKAVFFGGMSVLLHLPCNLLAWKGWEVTWGVHEMVWIRVHPTCTTDILLTSVISPFQYPIESCLVRLFALFSSFVPHVQRIDTDCLSFNSKSPTFQPLFVAMSSFVFRCQIACLQRWWLVWVAWPYGRSKWGKQWVEIPLPGWVGATKLGWYNGTMNIDTHTAYLYMYHHIMSV